MLNRILIVLLSALLLQACTGVPGIVEQPKVSIQNVALQDISLTSGTARVTLNVSNPNAFALPIEGIEYGLRLNGTPVAGGEQIQKMHIGPRQVMPIEIPVKLNFSELLRLLPNAFREQRVQYDLSGSVRLPLIRVPFRRQGGVGVKR